MIISGLSNLVMAALDMLPSGEEVRTGVFVYGTMDCIAPPLSTLRRGMRTLSNTRFIGPERAFTPSKAQSARPIFAVGCQTTRTQLSLLEVSVWRLNVPLDTLWVISWTIFTGQSIAQYHRAAVFTADHYH